MMILNVAGESAKKSQKLPSLFASHTENFTVEPKKFTVGPHVIFSQMVVITALCIVRYS